MNMSIIDVNTCNFVMYTPGWHIQKPLTSGHSSIKFPGPFGQRDHQFSSFSNCCYQSRSDLAYFQLFLSTGLKFSFSIWNARRWYLVISLFMTGVALGPSCQLLAEAVYQRFEGEHVNPDSVRENSQQSDPPKMVYYKRFDGKVSVLTR